MIKVKLYNTDGTKLTPLSGHQRGSQLLLSDMVSLAAASLFGFRLILPYMGTGPWRVMTRISECPFYRLQIHRLCRSTLYFHHFFYFEYLAISLTVTSLTDPAKHSHTLSLESRQEVLLDQRDQPSHNRFLLLLEDPSPLRTKYRIQPPRLARSSGKPGFQNDAFR